MCSGQYKAAMSLKLRKKHVEVSAACRFHDIDPRYETDDRGHCHWKFYGVRADNDRIGTRVGNIDAPNNRNAQSVLGVVHPESSLKGLKYGFCRFPVFKRQSQHWWYIGRVRCKFKENRVPAGSIPFMNVNWRSDLY